MCEFKVVTRIPNPASTQKVMKTEQQQDHARLEKFILTAALTCCAAMVYLLSVSLLS